MLLVRLLLDPLALLRGLGGAGALFFAVVMLRNLGRAPGRSTRFGAVYLALAVATWLLHPV